MQTTPPKTCVIYCRVSSKEQVEGTSLETQERQCRDYAASQGWTVVGVFVDKGESAKTVDRAEFLAAIKYCAERRPEFFLVHKLDRFSRNAQAHWAIREALLKYQTKLRSCSESIDESPEGEFMGGIHSLVAQFDNARRAQRTKQGMVERAREGYWVWSPPLGYYKPIRGKKTNIVPEPNLAPLIRAGFEEYAKGGRTYKAIAAFWTRLGLRTRRGKPIKMQEVQKVLRNPVYCGVIKSFGGEWAGGFESIVSRQLFLACQGGAGQGSSWSVPRKSDNATFPLRKFVICVECGTPLTGSVSKARGKGYAYYHHFKKACSRSKSIAKEKFERAFLEYLSKIAPDERYEKLFKAVIVDIWKASHKQLDDHRAVARRSIERLEADKQRVFELHRSGVYTDDDFKEQRAIITRQLDEQYALIEEQRAEEFDIEDLLDHCFEFVGKAAKTWIELEGNHQARIRFQSLIFKSRLHFDGQCFGNTVLSPIFQLKATSHEEKSLLVAPRGIEPLFPH